MKANSPEVIYLIDTGDGVAWCGDPDPTGYGECDDAVKYVRGDAYEALQAECAALVEALEAVVFYHEEVEDNDGNLMMHYSKMLRKVREALAAHRKQGGGND